MSTPPSSTSQPYASASLYVGDLVPEVTEAQLYEVFKTAGSVASIRVCRDAVTRRSLGYAYVNFQNVGDAERAIENLNFTPVQGKPCRVMWSQRDPAKRKTGTGNIFIKNLDKSINNSALYDTFSTFGHILSCKVEVDNNGVSKGYGFVHYDNQEPADTAIAKVNGMMIANKIVFVGPFQPKKARAASAPSQFTNLYVKNLDTAVTQDQLHDMFAPFGKVTSCAIMQDDEKTESKGFGFVNFEKPEEAQAAVDKLNDFVQENGKKMFVGRAQKRQERDDLLRQQRAEQYNKFQGTNVYVKNLDDDVTYEKLAREFERFGVIQSAKVMTDEKGNSRGFGFVCFTNAEDATRAIAEMNGLIFGTKPLYASIAQRKDVRHAQLAQLHQQKVSMMQMNMGMMNMRGGPGMFPPGAPPPGVYYPQMGGPRGPFPPPQMMPRGPGRYPAPPGPASGPQPPLSSSPPSSGMPYPPQAGGGFARGGDRGDRGGFGGNNVGQRMGNRTRNPRPPMGQPPMNGNGQGQGRGRGRGQPGNNNIKFNATARNQPGAPQQPQQEEQGDDGKQAAGEMLYGLIIAKTNPMLAGKITGMLLESHQIPDLYDIARNPPLLDGKIAEAMAVLQVHGDAPAQN